MENQDIDNEPKEKTGHHFFMLFLAVVGLVVGLLLLKYAIGALNLI